MKFPTKLRVVAVDSISGTPVSNVALILTLGAQRKNDFNVGPVITDQFGHVEFTKDACESTIERSKHIFIMDYWGDLESCKPTAEIRLHFPEHISGMIEQYRTEPSFWGEAFDDPPKLFAALQSVRNKEFEPATLLVNEDEICKRPEVRLLLKKK